MTFKNSVLTITLAILGSLLIAFAVLALCQAYFPSLSLDGRQGSQFLLTTNAVVMGIVGGSLSWKFNYSLSSLLTSLIIWEIVLLMLLFFFSGSWTMNSFNRAWIIYLNGYLVFPFLLASIISKITRKMTGLYR